MSKLLFNQQYIQYLCYLFRIELTEVLNYNKTDLIVNFVVSNVKYPVKAVSCLILYHLLFMAKTEQIYQLYCCLISYVKRRKIVLEYITEKLGLEEWIVHLVMQKNLK
ncbi:Hypothetical_protein [Hexamita inflata]|uniref:Hypothetical_protein n=1 Tax=Hexamita inflata TaxID=28002 RepID=A0AA86PBC9_9EUKA|nr:Hypothetical protein HINF_LOCUS23053 [Hexamita inflata]